jgi:hypothetical protein
VNEILSALYITFIFLEPRGVVNKKGRIWVKREWDRQCSTSGDCLQSGEPELGRSTTFIKGGISRNADLVNPFDEPPSQS